MPFSHMIEGETFSPVFFPDSATGHISEATPTYDYTFNLFGDRTQAVLAKETDLFKKISSFTATTEINGSGKPVVVTIPGLVVSSSTTFENQADFLQRHGINVLYMDYAAEGFSRELANAQILDMLHSQAFHDRKITLLGLSLGSGLIIDALLDGENGNFGNLQSVVLLGAVYSDDEVKNSAFAKTFRFANRHTPDVIANKFAPLAKRLFSLDPEYPPQSRSEVLGVPNETVIERIKALGQVNKISEAERIQTKAIIGWWDDDYSTQQARQRIEALFINSTVFNIPGHHAWTRSGSDKINEVLNSVLEL